MVLPLPLASPGVYHGPATGPSGKIGATPYGPKDRFLMETWKFFGRERWSIRGLPSPGSTSRGLKGQARRWSRLPPPSVPSWLRSANAAWLSNREGSFPWWSADKGDLGDPELACRCPDTGRLYLPIFLSTRKF